MRYSTQRIFFLLTLVPMSHFEEAERAADADLSPTAEDVDLAKEDGEDLTDGDLAQEDGEDAEDESEDAEDESEDVEDEEEDTSKGLTEVPPCAEGLPPTPPPVVEATPQPMLEVANVS